MTITLINEVPSNSLSNIAFILHTYCPRKMRQRSAFLSLLITTLQLSSGDAMEDFCLLLIQRVILRSLRRTQGLHKGSWIPPSRPHTVCPFSKASMPTIASKLQFPMGKQGAVSSQDIQATIASPNETVLSSHSLLPPQSLQPDSLMVTVFATD